MTGRDFYEEDEPVEGPLEAFEEAKARMPCRPYHCPASGEIECAAHSGFDVCCDRPDLHIELRSP